MKSAPFLYSSNYQHDITTTWLYIMGLSVILLLPSHKADDKLLPLFSGGGSNPQCSSIFTSIKTETRRHRSYLGYVSFVVHVNSRTFERPSLQQSSRAHSLFLTQLSTSARWLTRSMASLSSTTIKVILSHYVTINLRVLHPWYRLVIFSWQLTS